MDDHKVELAIKTKRQKTFIPAINHLISELVSINYNNCKSRECSENETNRIQMAEVCKEVSPQEIKLCLTGHQGSGSGIFVNIQYDH